MSLKLKIPGKLKFNVNGGSVNPSGSVSSAGTPATPAVPAPSTPVPSSAVIPGGSKPGPKLKFKTTSRPPTPAPSQDDVPQPKKTKTGRLAKPSAKLVESKKRVNEDSDSDNDDSTIAVAQPHTKRLKLTTKNSISVAAAAGPKTPGVTIKAKVKGRPPTRTLGTAYDSEASDREEDPCIEEQFILRMKEGDDCDYLRTAIAEKKIGIAKNLGGPDITMKFFHQDGRRAAITIRGHCYAATLVDLPCIIEGMKSWDRKGWLKSADICQMLWVFAPIQVEDDARMIDLPPIVDPITFQYPHGLTPPMHFARKRRFRKRISRTAIEAVEEAVEDLLQADKLAESTRSEMLDPDESRHGSRASSPGGSEDEEEYTDEDADADGEVDDAGYFNGAHGQGGPVESYDEDAMAAEFEAELEAELTKGAEGEALATGTPSSAPALTPSMLESGETPMAERDVEEDDSDDESLEDGDEEDEPPELDDETKARLAQAQSTREDIAVLRKEIDMSNGQLANESNAILRRRLEENIRKKKIELTLKISSLGPDGDEDD